MKHVKSLSALSAVLLALLAFPSSVFADVYDPSPVEIVNGSLLDFLPWILFIAIGLFLLAAAIVVVVLLVRHFLKKKKNPPKDR